MDRSACRLGLAALPLLLLGAAGCESEKITFFPEPEVDLGEPDTSDTGSSDDATGGADVVGGAGAMGTACEAPGDCASAFCLDEPGLDVVATELEVDLSAFAAPGGMCLSRGCSADEDCGAGASCTDMAAWGLAESWCLADCVELFGCRWQEGYTCHGLLEGAEDASGVCLPDAIVAAPPAPAAAIVGGPCEEDADCGTEFCFNDVFLDDLGEQFGLDTSPYDIPGGMCSAICFDDDACGPDGTCVNLQDTFGAPFNLCMKRCSALDDCRWDEGYQCFLADPEADLTVCLPDNLIIAAECDDGHCEEGG